MRLYEGMFILDDARCAEDFTGTVEVVHNILQQQGAEVVDSRKWDERKLSYPIRRHQRGVYVLIHFNADPLSIVQIERQFRLANDVVLRVLILVDDDGVTIGKEKEAEKAAREARKAEKAEQEAARKAEAEDTEESEEEETSEEEKESEADEEAQSEEEPEESEESEESEDKE